MVLPIFVTILVTITIAVFAGLLDAALLLLTLLIAARAALVGLAIALVLVVVILSHDIVLLLAPLPRGTAMEAVFERIQPCGGFNPSDGTRYNYVGTPI